MTIQAVVVEPNFTVTIKQLDGFNGIRQAVDGRHLELVPIGSDVAVYVDENGIAKALRQNQIATDAVTRMLDKQGRVLAPGDVIRGNAVFVGRKWVEDPEARLWDVPPEAVEQVKVDADLPQSVIEEFFPNALLESGFIVQAWLRASDFLFDATFDIKEWLAQASDEELLELDRAGWTGEPATKVSDWYEPRLLRVKSVYGYTRHNEGVTDVTEIDPKSGREWIRQHRPHLIEQLEDKDEET